MSWPKSKATYAENTENPNSLDTFTLTFNFSKFALFELHSKSDFLLLFMDFAKFCCKFEMTEWGLELFREISLSIILFLWIRSSSSENSSSNLHEVKFA